MSFTDLMSSSRGPGVLGSLMALLVLVGFGTLYLFVFDERLQGGQRTIEAVLGDQQVELDSLRSAIDGLEQRMAAAELFKRQATELALLASRAELADRRIAELGALRDAEAAALASASADWERYKDDYRAAAWAAAKGEKIDKLVTTGGKEFLHVTVKGVSHKGMDISHEGGLRLIPCEELPPELRDRFQFDAGKTAEDAAVTAAAVDLHSGSVDIARLATKATEKLARARELQAKVEATREKIESTKAELPERQAGISRMRSAIAVEKTKKLSRAPEMQEKLRMMEAKAEEVRRSIPLMQREVEDGRREIEVLNREVTGLKEEIGVLKEEVGVKQAAPANP
jgi:peptidoglycan hydrolase CwlO-like protein